MVSLKSSPQLECTFSLVVSTYLAGSESLSSGLALAPPRLYDYMVRLPEPSSASNFLLKFFQNIDLSHFYLVWILQFKFLLLNVMEIYFEIPQIFYRLSPNLM